jgi:ubiquinone/menaquinone biosynthesis C-methylase UbiE
MLILRIILCILAIPIAYLLLARIVRKIWNFPAPSYVGYLLDSKYRLQLQPPDQIIARSGIREDMQVLELGCGSGFFTPYLARAVGDTSKVYALDIQEDMLRQLQAKLAKPENSDVHNVETRLASAYELPFEDDALDAAVLITVLQEIPDKQKALREIKRVLKPGGNLAVSEVLPDPDYVMKSTTVKMGQQAGFELDEADGNLWSYTVRFAKA